MGFIVEFTSLNTDRIEHVRNSVFLYADKGDVMQMRCYNGNRPRAGGPCR